jgi:hypothetical protein
MQSVIFAMEKTGKHHRARATVKVAPTIAPQSPPHPNDAIARLPRGGAYCEAVWCNVGANQCVFGEEGDVLLIMSPHTENPYIFCFHSYFVNQSMLFIYSP